MISSLPVVVVFMFFCCGLYPMSRWVFPKIKSRNTAAAVHMAYGAIMCFVLFGRIDGSLCVLYVIISYFLITLPPLHASIISFILTMFSHLYIYLQGVSWAFDFTGFTMCLFQRVCSLSFNLEDGQKKAKGEKISEKWAAVALDKKPTFLEFCAYGLTPYGSFCNPFIEFKLFDYILERGNHPDSSVTEEDHKTAKFRFFGSFAHTVVVMISLEYTNMDLYRSQFYLTKPLIIRLIILTLFTAVLVLRYFCTWWLVESGLYEFGLASSGIVERDDISNLSLYSAMQSQTIQDWMRRWNHTTHLFWKKYLFTRLLNKKFSASFASTAVFVVSMSWHGCRPVFYMVLPETISLGKVDEYWNKKFPQTPNQPFWMTMLHRIWVVVAMMYTTSTWFFPWFKEFFEVRATVAFLPTLISIVLFVVLKFIPGKKRSSEKKNE